MKTKSLLTALSLFAFVMLAGIIGCSSSEDTNSGFVNEIFDSATSAVSEELANAIVEDESQNISPVEAGDSEIDLGNTNITSQFSDFIIQGDKLYAISHDQFFSYDMVGKEKKTYKVDGMLNTVVFHDGYIYAGGDALYKFVDTSLELVDDEFDGDISELYSYDYQLMIGTDEGLYQKGIFGKEKIADDISVSAMTSDVSGLWVGTSGDGLYRWDGEFMKKRFLKRDTALFDFVNTVDFKHNHLYLGCDNGLYIYNGGSWKTLTTADGLPDNNIRSIDASDWVVYIGSDKGVVSYYNDELQPVNKLEDRPVNVIKVKGRKLLASTPEDGIIEKRGNVVTSLLHTISLEDLTFLSLVP